MNYFSPPVFYYFHKTDYKSSAHAFVQCIAFALVSLKKKKRFNFGLLLVIFGTYKFRKKFIVDSMDIRGIKQGVNRLILNEGGGK
ncbi:hypothetical protein [Peribacillus sp. NPDC055009]